MGPDYYIASFFIVTSLVRELHRLTVGVIWVASYNSRELGSNTKYMHAWRPTLPTSSRYTLLTNTDMHW